MAASLWISSPRTMVSHILTSYQGSIFEAEMYTNMRDVIASTKYYHHTSIVLLTSMSTFLIVSAEQAGLWGRPEFVVTLHLGLKVVLTKMSLATFHKEVKSMFFKDC